MSLKLYFHPLSSFCQKALVALYENGTPFEPHIVDLADAKSSAAFKAIWPIGKIAGAARRGERPHRCRNRASSSSIWRSTIPGRRSSCRRTRSSHAGCACSDRFYDLYVNVPMQKVVTDKLRPSGKNDPYGVEAARALLQTAYTMIEQEMATKTWATGDAFTMADCAAGAGAVLRQHVDPTRRRLPEHGGVSPTLDGSPVLRSRDQGGAALLRAGPKITGRPRRRRSTCPPAASRRSSTACSRAGPIDAGVAPGPNLPAHAPDELMKRFGNLPLIHRPGERWMYRGGCNSLGVLIARVTGRSLAAFLRERIFDPLGMKYGVQRARGEGRPAGNILSDRWRDRRARAADEARGGRFTRPPRSRPEGAGWCPRSTTISPSAE